MLGSGYYELRAERKLLRVENNLKIFPICYWE